MTIDTDLATLLAFLDTHEFVGDIDIEEARAAHKNVETELERLRETLDAIENELGTLPLDHLGPATERSVSKAWAMAREKRPDPELIPSPLAPFKDGEA